MTQLIGSAGALGVFVPFCKNSCLQNKVNLPKDAGMLDLQWSHIQDTSKLVDLHIYKHSQHFMNRHGKVAALELALELTKQGTP